MLSADGTRSKWGAHACAAASPHMAATMPLDGAVVAVALGQGALAGDVIDVSRPERWQPGGEGGDGQDYQVSRGRGFKKSNT